MSEQPTTHNVTVSLMQVTRYNRKSNRKGTVLQYFGYGDAPEGMERDRNGRAAFEFVDDDAPSTDKDGNLVAAPNTFHFADVKVFRIGQGELQ